MGTIAEGGVGGDCEVCRRRGGSVSSRPPEGREHCWDVGTKELPEVSFPFCLFPLVLTFPPSLYPNRRSDTHFPPPVFHPHAPYSHTCLPLTFFFFKYPKLRPILAFLLGLDHPVRTKITRLFRGRKKRKKKKKNN